MLAPKEIYLNNNETFAHFKNYPRIKQSAFSIPEQKGKFNFTQPSPPDIQVDHKLDAPLAKLESFLMESAQPVVFSVESSGRRESLLELLHRIDVAPYIIDSWHDLQNSDFEFAITEAPLENTFFSEQLNTWIISENALFGERIRQRRRQKEEKDQSENVIRNLTELTPGAAVVHMEHGVGATEVWKKSN